ncbi:MAG TPA: hypothetical protein PKC67_09295 [Kiritimatiellia bacterium]|nr:hypothetical protein [Kiritimatiellia bacterium]HMP34535.1 hypothetical protein [Kiritimatiellia bacterium]
MTPRAATLHLLLAALALSGLTACRTPPDPEAIERATETGQRKPGAKKIMLIETPRRMREDIRYPATTRMGFFWSETTAEWRFRLPATGYAHSGFRFLVPHNLAQARDLYELRFRIAPAGMTRHLWIGLVDGLDEPERVLVDLPLKRYAPDTSGRGFIEVRIPLSDFATRGVIIADPNAPLEAEPGEAAFNWMDVLEVRFINNGGRIPSRETIVTDLRFER